VTLKILLLLPYDVAGRPDGVAVASCCGVEDALGEEPLDFGSGLSLFSWSCKVLGALLLPLEFVAEPPVGLVE